MQLTILAVLQAGQVLETSSIQRSKGLAGDGGHCDITYSMFCEN